jgi:hypothetical protein
MFFSTANSSFILLLLRRSMRLCAVFLAIFRPAALVAEGGFLFPAGADLVAWLVGEKSAAGGAEGFICMIFLVRVGGGGSANGSRGFDAGAVRFLPVVPLAIFVGVNAGE